MSLTLSAGSSLILRVAKLLHPSGHQKPGLRQRYSKSWWLSTPVSVATSPQGERSRHCESVLDLAGQDRRDQVGQRHPMPTHVGLLVLGLEAIGCVGARQV